MTAYSLQVEQVDELEDRVGSLLDTAIEWILAGLIVFAPLAFGVVEPWSEQVVVGGAGVLSLTFIFGQARRSSAKIPFSIALIPVGLFLALAGLQMVSLPESFIARVSAGITQLRTAIVSPAPGATTSTLSLYPHATAHDLRLLLSVVSIFVVSLATFREPARIKRLLVLISILGGGLALLALAQDITDADKIYWIVDGVAPRARAGTFILYNHFSQFMNLTMGASLALLLMEIEQSSSRQRHSYFDAPDQNARRRRMWLFSASILVGATTVALSLSRAGVVTMVLAFAVTGALIGSKRRSGQMAWTMGGLAALLAAGVLLAGSDVVINRVATLRHFSSSYSDRWQIVKDIAVGWKRFPILGTGLGTHEYVYPMLDSSLITRLATHAENEYAQMLEETGALGLLLILAFAGIVLLAYRRCLAHGALRESRPIALGLGTGLLAIFVHSFVDFGQHLPANAFLTAIYCAVLLNLGRRPAKKVRAENTARSFRSRTAFAVASVCIVVAFGWAFLGANTTRQAAAAWDDGHPTAVQLEHNKWQGDNESFALAIQSAQRAAEIDPANITYRYWLNVYRWRAMSRDHDPLTGQIRLYGNALQYVSRIVTELHDAERVCPTYGPAYSMAGQLRVAVLADAQGADEIRRGYQLAQCDASACFYSGLMDAREEKWDQSLTKFQRAHALGWSANEIFEAYVGEARRPDLALAVAGTDPIARLELARRLEAGGDPEYRQISENLRSAAEEDRQKQLEAECALPEARAEALSDLADIYVASHKDRGAIELYQRALATNFGQLTWRLSLARALHRVGATERALDEARVCLRLQPGQPEAQKLVTELDNAAVGSGHKSSGS